MESHYIQLSQLVKCTTYACINGTFSLLVKINNYLQNFRNLIVQFNISGNEHEKNL